MLSGLQATRLQASDRGLTAFQQLCDTNNNLLFKKKTKKNRIFLTLKQLSVILLECTLPTLL